ncbi:MAG TPA: hypothetical protein VLI93_16020 [Acetobacteraceae bacterium]|nr:hypothetical protein [Acetobacteraceae bacterium]
MIAPPSLAAFSSTPSGTAAGLSNIRPVDALRPFSRLDQPSSAASPPQQGAAPAQTEGSPQPPRTTPRGSLLDLTV